MEWNTKIYFDIFKNLWAQKVDYIHYIMHKNIIASFQTSKLQIILLW